MRLNLLLRTLFVFSLMNILSCGDKNSSNPNPNSPNLNSESPLPNLNDIDYITISYSMRNHGTSDEPFSKHHILIEEPARVQSVLSTIHIKSGEKLKFSGLMPYGLVTFTKKNGQGVSTFFVKSNQLNVSQWGQLYITEDLYRLACEISSAVAGRPIDVLKLND